MISDSNKNHQRLKYRQAVFSDLPFIVSVYNQAIEEGNFTADLDLVSVETKTNWFEVNKQLIFIVETSDYKPIGYFYFSPWRRGRRALDKVMEITAYVGSDFRGSGVGSFILESIFEIAKDLKLEFLIAILLDVNKRSEHLLAKYGFIQSGYLPLIAHIKNNKICGQLIMMKKL